MQVREIYETAIEGQEPYNLSDADTKKLCIRCGWLTVPKPAGFCRGIACSAERSHQCQVSSVQASGFRSASERAISPIVLVPMPG